MTVDRWQNWAVIAGGYAAGIVGVFRFPAYVPTVQAILIALMLPISATVICLSTRIILAKDTSNPGNGSLAMTYGRILSGVILFIVALHLLTVAAVGGTLPPVSWLARAPIVLFGLLAIWVGNLLPRTRPNLALGIRTRRTLWNRDAWIRTHRVAGYAAVFLGLLFVTFGLFFSKQHIETILGPVSIAAALLLAAEYLRSRTM
jgi:hypothetical protein